jgi:hypothetical protein
LPATVVPTSGAVIRGSRRVPLIPATIGGGRPPAKPSTSARWMCPGCTVHGRRGRRARGAALSAGAAGRRSPPSRCATSVRRGCPGHARGSCRPGSRPRPCRQPVSPTTTIRRGRRAGTGSRRPPSTAALRLTLRRAPMTTPHGSAVASAGVLGRGLRRRRRRRRGGADGTRQGHVAVRFRRWTPALPGVALLRLAWLLRWYPSGPVPRSRCREPAPSARAASGIRAGL